jgi:hypothetical protein
MTSAVACGCRAMDKIDRLESVYPEDRDRYVDSIIVHAQRERIEIVLAVIAMLDAFGGMARGTEAYNRDHNLRNEAYRALRFAPL